MTAVAAELRTFTPLGVRFWDAVSDTPVTAGLRVVARPLRGSSVDTEAFVTLSGVYAFRGLPGLHNVEFPAGAGASEAREELPAPTTFVVSADDRFGRFLPTTVLVPAPYFGLAPMLVDEPDSSSTAVAGSASSDGPHDRPPEVEDLVASPPSATFPRIFLFPAPSRQPPPGIAVIRASLEVQGTGEPAAFARIDVEVGGARWAGVAAANGNAAIMFPYPRFGGAVLASPPVGSSGVPSQTQSWPVTVSVRFEPERHHQPRGCAAPTLASILTQSQTLLWADVAGPPADAVVDQLTFGREFVLSTTGSERSSLLIGGASP